MKYTAIENRLGAIEIRKEKKYNGIMIGNTVLCLQYQAEIDGFYDELNDDDSYMITNGFEIDISNNQIIIDYIDANILPY
jgi:hypothetical protein